MKRSLGWKVKRELRRFGRQVVSLPALLHERLVATPLYDRRRDTLLLRRDGVVPEGPRVAIYLIFPSTGLLASHLMALRYLCSKGYAPLVVSNLPLSETDRTQLLAHCWKSIERPNTGYDFGGYRDGVLDLAPRMASIERLVILNDSCWFPLPGSQDWLEQAEALTVDFVGACGHNAMPVPESTAFRDIRWSYDDTRDGFHYSSYAFFLRPGAFRNPAFMTFWKRLRLSEDKSRVVRHGEFAFTRAMSSQGVSHGATLDISDLDRKLAALPSDILSDIAQEMIMFNHPQMRRVQQEALAGPLSKDELIALILASAASQGASYALAAYSIPHQGFPFLKKSPLWLERYSSDSTLKIAARLDGPEGATILAEAQDLRRTRGSHLDIDGAAE